jgi:hypothetical protein
VGKFVFEKKIKQVVIATEAFGSTVKETIESMCAVEDAFKSIQWNSYEIQQIRLVSVTGIPEFLVRLISKEGENGEWLCENLRTGHHHWVDERYMSTRGYNDLEAFAWLGAR